MSAITPSTPKVETSSSEADQRRERDAVQEVASSALSIEASSPEGPSTAELSGRVTLGKEEADPDKESLSGSSKNSDDHKYGTLKGTGLFVGGVLVQPKKPASRRRRILSKLFPPKEAQNLDVPTHIAGMRELYANYLLKLRESYPELSFEALTDKFLSEIPPDNHVYLEKFGLDTAENIESFFDFVERRKKVETKTVSPEFEFGSAIISKQKPEDIISSFRCAKQPSPPTGFENIPFLALNDKEIPLPNPWEKTEKSFFTWLFKECNAIFEVDYPVEKMVAEFCEQKDFSNIPYIQALQALTISAFAPIGTSCSIKSGERDFKAKYEKYCYKISYNPEDQTFKATQIKVVFLKPLVEAPGEDKKFGRVIMHLSVSGKIGDDHTEATLEFKDMKFNMGEHYSVWNQMVQLLDAIEIMKI